MHLEAAESANAKGNKHYCTGCFEPAVEEYTSALDKAAVSTGSTGAGFRSKYYANRAQARMQLKEFEEASRDCQASLSEDPSNVKACVRWGLCAEALNGWDEALIHFERTLTLAQKGTILWRAALEGSRRARANRDIDRKVSREEAIPRELVHHGQMLRLSFRKPLPLQWSLGSWFVASVGISNEFGLWRRNDLVRATEEMRQTYSPASVVPSSQTDKAGSDKAGSGPSVVSSVTSGWTTGVKEPRLKLVVEARSLEEFGGHPDYGIPRAYYGSKSDENEGKTNDVAQGSDDDANNLPLPPSNGHRIHRGSSFSGKWIADAEAIEDDDNGAHAIHQAPTIGSAGKATFRVRFRSAAISPSLWDENDEGPLSKGFDSAPEEESVLSDRRSDSTGEKALESAGWLGGVAPTGPWRFPSETSELVMLRVSIKAEEAEALLGRTVVPVLSLPIAISRHSLNEGEAYGESGTMAVTEPIDLTSSAFCTGATNCREVAVPVADSVAMPPATSAALPACITVQGVPLPKGSSTGGLPRGRSACNPSEARRGGCEGQHITSGNNDASQGLGNHGNRNRVEVKERMVLVAESPGQLGIGGKVWDSAFVLCDFLAKTRASALSRDSSACSSSWIPVGNIPAEDRAPIYSKSQAQFSWPEECKREPFHVASVLESDPNTILTTPESVGSDRSDPGIRSEEVGNKSSGKSSTQPVQPVQPIRPIQPIQPIHPMLGEGREKGIVEGRRVLELGAGTGLVSICCALLGAAAVVATDLKEITRLIDLNVALNFSLNRPWASRSRPSAPSHGSTSRPQSAPLIGAGLAEADGQSIPGRASPPGDTTGSPPLRGVLEDSWSKASVASAPLVWGQHSADVQTFDPEVVVMSDVVYDPAGYEPLLKTLQDIMHKGMMAVMAHRHRHPQDHEFFRRLKEAFVVREEPARILSLKSMGMGSWSSPTACNPGVMLKAQMSSSDVLSQNMSTRGNGDGNLKGEREELNSVDFGVEQECDGSRLGGTDVKIFCIWSR